MGAWWTTWLTAWQGLTPLMLLSSGLSAALVVRLLLPPRRPPPILPSQFPVAAAPAPAAEHRLVVAARQLFGALPILSRWYPAALSRTERRIYAGLEGETISTLVGMHLVAAALGMGIGGAVLVGLSLAVHLPLITVLWGTLGAGLVYGLVQPPSLIAQRIRARDAVMATQLVPWVRDIQMQLLAKKPPLEALRLATEVRCQTEPNPLPGQALDLYREADLMLTRLAGRQVPSASEALKDMAHRCHQVTVVNTLVAIQCAVDQGTQLENMLRALERSMVEEIEALLKLLVERRQIQATALTTIVAFVVLVGIIGGFVATQFIHAFAAVP